MLTRPNCCSRRSLRFDAWTLGILFSFLVSLTAPASAQEAAATAPPPVVQTPSKPQALNKPDAAPHTSISAVASPPLWQDLTPVQQASLKPLAANWDTLPSFRKKKWMAIAANFLKLSEPEQVKLHSRMSEWVALSQQQRTQARMNFAESKQLTSSEKTATWQAYQALSTEEKQKLATLSPIKPISVTATSKPTPANKLVKLPIKQPVHTPVAKVAANNRAGVPSPQQSPSVPELESVTNPKN